MYAGMQGGQYSDAGLAGRCDAAGQACGASSLATCAGGTSTRAAEWLEKKDDDGAKLALWDAAEAVHEVTCAR